MIVSTNKRPRTYCDPLLRPVFVIRVVNSCYGTDGDVANAGSLSSSDKRSFSNSWILSYCFILQRTIERSNGIRPVFRKADLQSFEVKVRSENLLNKKKKSALVIWLAL